MKYYQVETLSKKWKNCSITMTSATIRNGSIFVVILFIISGLIYACESPCVQPVTVEIPISTPERDTFEISDTIRYTVILPNEVKDERTGQSFSSEPMNPRLDLLISDMDNVFDFTKGFDDFEIVNLVGEVIPVIEGDIPLGLIQLADGNQGKVGEFLIIPRRAGRFVINIDSYYNLSSRVGGDAFTKNVELIGSNDCIEELNLVYSLNNGSSRGYDFYHDLVSPRIGSFTLEEFQQSGLFVFVVE